MFAADPAVNAFAAVVSLASLLVSGIIGGYVAFNNRRKDKVVLGDDHYTRTITGFKDLLDAQDQRIDELEELVSSLRVDVKTARKEAAHANAHAVECERDLRAAKRRISELEDAV